MSGELCRDFGKKYQIEFLRSLRGKKSSFLDFFLKKEKTAGVLVPFSDNLDPNSISKLFCSYRIWYRARAHVLGGPLYLIIATSEHNVDCARATATRPILGALYTMPLFVEPPKGKLGALNPNPS